MTPAELAVLTILARSSEPVGWYAIERRLSNVRLAERPHLPRLLDDLVARDLVGSVGGDDARYAITPRGLAALETSRAPS